MPRCQVFISYAAEDAPWLRRLHQYLHPLERAGGLAVWDNTRPLAGTSLPAAVSEALASAHTALILLSEHYLASDDIDKEELPKLLGAAAQQGLKVQLLLLRPCAYDLDPRLAQRPLVNPTDEEFPLGRPLAAMDESTQGKVLSQLGRSLVGSVAPPRRRRRAVLLAALGVLAAAVPAALWARPRLYARYLDRGVRAAAADRLNEAVTSYQLALLLGPRQSIAHLNLGVAYQRQGLIAQAEQQYHRALELDEDCFAAYDLLAKLLIEGQRYQEAMRYLDRGVKALSAQQGRQPAETERRWRAALHRNLAWAQWGRGLHQQALADSDAALALMPQSAAVHCVRALIFKELKQCQNEQQAWLGCIQYMNRPADATERQWSAQAQERLLASCSAPAPP